MLTGNKRETFDNRLAEKYKEIDNINNIRFFFSNENDILRIITADYKFLTDSIENIDCSQLYDEYYNELNNLYTNKNVNTQNIVLYINNTKSIYNIDKIANTEKLSFFTLYKCTRQSSNGKIDDIYLKTNASKQIASISIGKAYNYMTPIKEIKEKINPETNKTEYTEGRGLIGKGILVIENIIDIDEMTIEPKISSQLKDRLPVWELISIEGVNENE